MNQRGKNRQRIVNVTKVCRIWRTNLRKLKKLEEALPRLNQCDLEKASKLFQAKRVGCDGFHPKVPMDLTKETKVEMVELVEKVEQRWKMAATSLHDDVLFDPEECYK